MKKKNESKYTDEMIDRMFRWQFLINQSLFDTIKVQSKRTSNIEDQVSENCERLEDVDLIMMDHIKDAHKIVIKSGTDGKWYLGK